MLSAKRRSTWTSRVISWALLGTCACGQAALNGLKPGEQRLENQIGPEGPPVQPESSAGGRVFAGEVADDVTIAEGETVWLKAEPDGAGGWVLPRFTGRVVVGAGATLGGSAEFLGGLVLQGKQDAPVTWNVSTLIDSRVVGIQADWAVLIGGAVAVEANDGELASLRDTRFDHVQLKLIGRANSRVEVTWSRLDDSPVTISMPSGWGKTRAEIVSGPLVRLVTSEVDASQIRLAATDFYWQGVSIEANNFLGLPVGGYVEDNDDSTTRHLRYAIARTCYLWIRPSDDSITVFDDDDVSMSSPAYQVIDLLTDRLVAGPGGYEPVIITSSLPTDIGGIIVAYPRSDRNFVAFPPRGLALRDTMLTPLLWSALQTELRPYGWKGDDPEGASIRLRLSQPPACTVVDDQDSYPYPWLDLKLDCPATIDIPIKAEVLASGTIARTLSLQLHLEAFSGGHVDRQIRLMVLGMIADLADDGLIVPAPVQSPFY
jgi:hypothetical protein